MAAIEVKNCRFTGCEVGVEIRGRNEAIVEASEFVDVGTGVLTHNVQKLVARNNTERNSSNGGGNSSPASDLIELYVSNIRRKDET